MYCENCGSWNYEEDMIEEDGIWFCDEECAEEFWEGEY